jgi:diguanylate cyclase (GGDEF)-like protein
MSRDNKFFNKNILYFVSIFFVLVVIARISYSYVNVKEYEVEYAKKEADTLKEYGMAHRQYYQNLYISKVIKLNEKTLHGLPAYSSRLISENFSQDNSFNIVAKTVSDNARNRKNMADALELKAIKYFKNNSNKEEYFDTKDQKVYQYAHVLRIEKKCLKCHGKKEKAPLFIQKNYDKAYDYKLGEVRGILSIKIPKESLENFFIRFFYYSVVYDMFLLLLLFAFLFYLLKKFKSINYLLENEVNRKTLEVNKNKKALEKLLITDRLTRLLNRQKLIEDISVSIKAPSRHLALVNIDRFKDINDFYGHEIADKLLIELASLLINMYRNSKSTVYKLPSDEFAIYTTQEITPKEFKNNILMLVESVEKTKFEVEEYSIYLSISCGIASNDKPLILKADMALQKSKQTHVNVEVYDDSISVEDNIKNNIKGLTLLKKAIKDDQIIPFFQPIYSLEDSKISKYECLVRIIKNDETVIAPYQFLDIAMKSKLYSQITKRMIEKSFKYFEDKEYEFSINISIEDVLNINTVEFILKSLKDYKNAHKVVFEILESDKVENYGIMKKFIDDIKEFGCKVAIDDFGSGYSNFSHIMELKIDYLKIDSSLVKNILTDENSRKITQTIIHFAKELGMETIAEFVEDEESLNLLKEMGSSYAQGYYIGKPSSKI